MTTSVNQNIQLRKATVNDIQKILFLLSSNYEGMSLFQQTEKEIRKNIYDFILAEDEKGKVIGCAALHKYNNDIAEILAVSVLPENKNSGIGKSLITKCIDNAVFNNINLLWLATSKPGYFSRYKFQPISKWSLPANIIFHKFKLVFRQPVKRWIPAFFGRHTFMKYK